MKIAIFTDTYAPQINGVVTSTLTSVHELESLGHEVLVIGPKLAGASHSTDKIWRFRSMAFPFQKEYTIILPFSRKLRKFSDTNWDIIHIQTPFFMGHLGQYIAWKYKIPSIHTYHTHWEEYTHYFPLLPKKIRKFLFITLFSRLFCNRCNHIVVPSYQIQEKLVTYGVTTPKTVIPTGVISPVVSPKQIALFKQKWGISSSQKVIVFVGRLGAEKNVYFLLEAFLKIAHALPDTILLIAGDGPERGRMLNKLSEYGLRDRCIFTGYITHHDVFVAYAASDILAFPSTTETQGLSVLEGLSMGIPAVCINAMGVKEILSLERGGFLTENNVDSFSQALLTLLTDTQLYQEKSQQARKQAQQFSAPNMTKQLVSAYTKTLEAYSSKKH